MWNPAPLAIIAFIVLTTIVCVQRAAAGIA